MPWGRIFFLSVGFVRAHLALRRSFITWEMFYEKYDYFLERSFVQKNGKV